MVDRESPHPESSPAREDPPSARDAGPAPASTRKDPLKSLMPSGEASGRNPPEPRPASSHGGTSGAEDTTRTAGYFVDFTVTNEPPPGPPVPKDPALITPSDKAPPPPRPAAPAGRAADRDRGDAPDRDRERRA